MLFSFSGSSLVGSHSPQKLSSVTYSPEGVCIGAGPPASLWLSAQSLSSALGDSSSRMTSGCAALRGRALRRAARSLEVKTFLLGASFQGRLLILKSGVDTGMTAQKKIPDSPYLLE